MNSTITNHSLTSTPYIENILSPDVGKLIIRASLGSVLLAHSLYLKLVVFTLPGTAQFFASIGLPEFLAYAVFGIEAVAGIAIILGVKTRVFSALVVPVLLGATWVHSSNGWLFSNEGGGWEFPLFLSIIALAQMALGDGKYSISSKD
jgi:putative oxidoreductase